MKIKFLTPFLDFGQSSWKKSLDPLKMSLGALWFTDFYSTWLSLLFDVNPRRTCWRNDVVKAKNDVFLGFLMISGQMIPRNHKVLHMVIYSIYPATSYEILFNFNLGKEEYPKCHMLLCRRNKCVCIIQNWQIRKILFEFMQRNVGCFSTMKSRETRCYIMKFSYIFLE